MLRQGRFELLRGLVLIAAGTLFELLRGSIDCLCAEAGRVKEARPVAHAQALEGAGSTTLRGLGRQGESERARESKREAIEREAREIHQVTSPSSSGAMSTLSRVQGGRDTPRLP